MPTHIHSRRGPVEHSSRTNLIAVASILIASLASALAFITPLASNTNYPQTLFGVREVQCIRSMDASPRRHSILYLATSQDDTYVEADDFDAVQGLFQKFCDADGLMTKSSLLQMPPFSEMLEEKELLLEELEDIWDAAPKFPDVSGENTRIDVDSFVQIYRDVDDLFEDEDDDDEEGDVLKDSTEDAVEGEDPQEQSVENELERVYESLCDDAGLVSKETLRQWDEIEKLLEEGLLGEDEFDELWAKTQKSPGSNEQLLDVDGFLSFNVALDILFEFEDDEFEEDDDDDDEDDDSEDEELPTTPQNTRKVVEEEDLPPGVLFAAIADEDYLVGMDDLKYWGDLQNMLEEGDILPTELQSIYDSIEKSESGKLDEEGFTKLFEEIDELFEDDSEEDGKAEDSRASIVKEDLIAFIDIINTEDMLPCGLECNEKDQKQVLNIVQALEEQPTNLVRLKNGNIDLNDLAGTWELLYSSSAAMRFNQGLSGIGGSFPNGKFGGLKQTFKASKFLTDVEYKERIEVTPSTASFDVTVTGNWDIRSSVSLFTGQPSIIVEIEPDRVNYGPTSTRADHWKSLGPMNMLDLTYLDENFRVMRGCTSADSVFIFKKEQ